MTTDVTPNVYPEDAILSEKEIVETKELKNDIAEAFAAYKKEQS